MNFLGNEEYLCQQQYFQRNRYWTSFKSSIGRGGTTEDIYISNIYMNDIKDDAIVFETTYFDNHVGAKKQSKTTTMDFVPDFKDIHISNVICRDARNGITAHGEKE